MIPKVELTTCGNANLDTYTSFGFIGTLQEHMGIL